LAKHDVKIIATNNTFYIDKEIRMLTIFYCVRDKQQTHIVVEAIALWIAQSGILFQVGRRNETAFATCPEAISNISEIVDKIEDFAKCYSKI
jgi:DNA polymerase-3 subunit alpha